MFVLMLIILVFLYFHLFVQLPRCLRAIFSSVWPHFLELFQNSFVFSPRRTRRSRRDFCSLCDCDECFMVENWFFDRIEAERRKTDLGSPEGERSESIDGFNKIAGSQRGRMPVCGGAVAFRFCNAPLH